LDGTMTMLSLLTATLLALCPQGDDEIPPGAVARVNGALVEREVFYEWLVRTQASSMLDAYLSQVVVEQEARRLGVSLSPDELDAALERRWDQFVLSTHGGDEARALRALAKVGLDRRQRMSTERSKVELKALATKVIRARRDPTADDLAKLSLTRFGKGAVRIELRMAFFRRYRDLQPGVKLDSEEAQAAAAAALLRAHSFVDTMSESTPEQAAELIRTRTDPLRLQFHKAVFVDLRRQGGHLAYYQPSLFVEQLEPAISTAEVGTVVGPIETPDGFYVAEVLRHEPAPFSEVREELVRLFRDAPATPKEIYLLQRELMEGAKIEKGRVLPPRR